MTVTIEESGMLFGPFEEESVFYIEKSAAYRAIQDHVKIAEFVTFDNQKHQLIVLEAKTSAPNPNSSGNPDRFAGYIGEIEEKLCNAFDLYMNQALCSTLPPQFEDIDYNNTKIVFMLVIKNHLKEWLIPVKDALEKAVNHHIRYKSIWKCSVIVLNAQMAKSKGIIS